MANKNVAKKSIATAQSLAASFFTEVTNVENMDSIAWTVSTSSVTSNTGTFSFQVRDRDPITNLDSDWIDVAFTPTPALASANTTLYLFATQIEATEARLKFTVTGSPDGTAKIWVHASRRGA